MAPSHALQFEGLHEDHRRALRIQTDLDVPSAWEMAQARRAAGDITVHEECYRPRSFDLINLNLWVCRHVHNFEPTEFHLLWDISSSSTLPHNKNPMREGTCPCFLMKHDVYDTRLRRSLWGLEKLYVHGFQRDINVAGISNDSLYKLAGNTVTGPLCGIIWAAMFAYVDFSRPHGKADMSQHKVGAEREAFHVKGAADRLDTSTVDARGQPWMHLLPSMPLPQSLKRKAPGGTNRSKA